MSNKSALGAFSPYNPDYGRNAALLAFGATMLQNAGRQPFGRGVPISTAQALGSGALAGLGAYGQAEQQQYARTKPNYQVINDQLVSITPPTERGGQPTIETIQDLRTPTVPSAPTVKEFFEDGKMVTKEFKVVDGVGQWVNIGQGKPVGEKQHLIRNGAYVYDWFRDGDQKYAETSPQWVTDESGVDRYRVPMSGDRKWVAPTIDQKQWVKDQEGNQHWRIPETGDRRLEKDDLQWVKTKDNKVLHRVPQEGDIKYNPDAQDKKEWVTGLDSKTYHRVPIEGDQPFSKTAKDLKFQNGAWWRQVTKDGETTMEKVLNVPKQLEPDKKQWLTRNGKSIFDIPRDGDEPHTQDKFTAVNDYVVYNKKGKPISRKQITHDQNREAYEINPNTGKPEKMMLPDGFTMHKVGVDKETTGMGSSPYVDYAENQVAAKQNIRNTIGLYNDLEKSFLEGRGQMEIGLTGATARGIEMLAAQFDSFGNLLKKATKGKYTAKEEAARAKSVEGYLVNGEINVDSAEQDIELKQILDESLNYSFLQRVAGESAEKKSMILNLAYKMAAAENDGRPSDKDVKYAIQRLGGQGGSAVQMLGSIRGTIRTSYNNYVNYAKSFAEEFPDVEIGELLSLEELGFKPTQGTTPTSRTQTTPFETFSPEQLRANPNLEERQTANGTIYFVPKRQ